MVPRGDRTNTVIEPMLTNQWFVAMSKPAPAATLHPGKSITDVALQVVADGRIKFYPENWTTPYNQWLEKIQDWCISRQLRSEEHTSELQSLMRISYAVFCLKKNNNKK